MRQAERIYDVGLIDLVRARSDGRRAQPGSLAQQVQPRSELLQPYVDTVLGDIICCETVDELRRYRRAVTPEVVLYGEYTVRALHPRTYTPWYIGARAQRSQIEARERELREVREQLAALEPEARDLRARVVMLRRGRSLSNLRQRLDAPLDERPLRAEIAERAHRRYRAAGDEPRDLRRLSRLRAAADPRRPRCPRRPPRAHRARRLRGAH